MEEFLAIPPGDILGVNKETYDVIEKGLFDLWSVVNELSRIHPPQPEYFRVTIFGSSRLKKGDPLYDQVRDLARQLSAMGCDIVTGGGPGLMAAANEGEQLGDPHNRTRSIGLVIQLPAEERPNPFIEKLYRHRTFFSRLHQFVRLSSAFIVVPGGIGTTLETLMIWQLLQVKHIQGVPLIFIGEMWRDLALWAKKHMLSFKPELAGAADLDLPICVETVDDAIRLVREHLQRFRAARRTAREEGSKGEAKPAEG